MILTQEQWLTIRAKYETEGVSQRTLALQYGVSQPVISARANKENWRKNVAPITITPALNAINSSDETDIDALLERFLQRISNAFKADAVLPLEPKDIKSLMDATSQVIKARLLLKQHAEPDTRSGIAADLLPLLTMEELNHISELQGKIDELLELARARKLEYESGIVTIRAGQR